MIAVLWLEVCRFFDFPELVKVAQLTRKHRDLVKHNLTTLAVSLRFTIRLDRNDVIIDERRLGNK
ncbi:hypothetical protein AAVH_33181, partial [Aphelenchoides avenae]